MRQIIFATVENGLVKPDREIGLSSGAEVRFTLEPCYQISTDSVVQGAQRRC